MPVKIATVGPTFSCPATVYLPSDNGQAIAHRFSVVFRRVKSSEFLQLAKEADAGMTNRQLLDKVVAGWGGMLDANGTDVPYSQVERIATEEEYPGTEMAMAVAFWDHAQINQRQAAEKNSAAPSVTA